MCRGFDDAELLFYGRRAAKGYAREHWTAVYIGMLDTTVYIWVVLDHAAAEDDLESLSDIEGDIWADLYSDQIVVSGFTDQVPHQPPGVQYVRCWPVDGEHIFSAHGN